MKTQRKRLVIYLPDDHIGKAIEDALADISPYRRSRQLVHWIKFGLDHFESSVPRQTNSPEHTATRKRETKSSSQNSGQMPTPTVTKAAKSRDEKVARPLPASPLPTANQPLPATVEPQMPKPNPAARIPSVPKVSPAIPENIFDSPLPPPPTQTQKEVNKDISAITALWDS